MRSRRRGRKQSLWADDGKKDLTLKRSGEKGGVEGCPGGMDRCVVPIRTRSSSEGQDVLLLFANLTGGDFEGPTAAAAAVAAACGE